MISAAYNPLNRGPILKRAIHTQPSHLLLPTSYDEVAMVYPVVMGTLSEAHSCFAPPVDDAFPDWAACRGED